MGELKLRPVATPTGRAAGPTPLNALGEAELCPGSAALARINASLR